MLNIGGVHLRQARPAGRLSSEFTQTFTFLQAFNDLLHHSRRAVLTTSSVRGRLHFVSIFFLNYNARACMLSESTFGQVDAGRQAKVHVYMVKDFLGKKG